MINEIGDDEAQQSLNKMSKKSLSAAKYQLKVLLDTPVEKNSSHSTLSIRQGRTVFQKEKKFGGSKLFVFAK
jgi:hypothetical protein